MLAPAFRNHYNEIPILKTIASQKEGVKELYNVLIHELQKTHVSEKKFWLLAEKAFYLLQKKRMKDIDKAKLGKEIEDANRKNDFNLYKFIADK
jgi:LAO/AO transport system kinase